MERLTIILLLVCGANAGFMDRLNDLYNRWNSGSNQQYVYAQNERQNLVSADQLLPEALLHQQILGPQLAAAGYSGAQIVAGPIAVPLKNLPRPPGLTYQQQPAPPQPQPPVYQQRPKQPAAAANQHHAPQYQPQAQPVAPNYQVPTQPPAPYAPQPVQYQQSPQPQHKPVLKYQPTSQNQQYPNQPSLQQPTSVQYQAASVQYQPQSAPQYQAPAHSLQFQPQQHHKAPAADSLSAGAQQPVAYQQPLPYVHSQAQTYPKPAPAVHQNYVPPAVQHKPAPQHYAIPQQYQPSEASRVVQNHQHVQQYAQPEVQHYSSVPVQQTSQSQQASQVYRPAAPHPQPSYHNSAHPPTVSPKSPVYQHVQRGKPADQIHASANYHHTVPTHNAVVPVASAQYYPGQVFNAENVPKGVAFDHAAPVKYQNSEWTPIPKQQFESSTAPSQHQGSDGVLFASASAAQSQQIAADISDADLQNLNFNHVFDGVVPDIPEIPHGFDLSMLGNMSAFANFDPSLAGLDPSALAHLKDPSALAHLKDPNVLAQLQGNPQALAAFSSQASNSNQVAQAKKDNFVPESEKPPAQGRSSEGPVRTSIEPVKVSPVVKKLKSRPSAKNETIKTDGKSELTKVKRRKVADSTGKILKSATVSTTTEPAISITSSTTTFPSDPIITASWKTEKPQAVPRIGEGSGRFVGRVLPAENSDITPVKSSAQLSDGIFVSNVGYSIKFTSRR